MAVAGGPNIVEDGLVLALDAANKKSYPGSGTMWNDLITNSTGSIANGPVYSSANGGTIIFDGSNDYAYTGFVQPTNTSSDSFTWAIWIYLGANPPINAVIFGNRVSGTGGTQWIKITPTNFERIGYSNAPKIAYTVPTQEWRNLTIVKNQTNLQYYSNGTLVGTQTHTTTVDSTPVYVGGDVTTENSQIIFGSANIYNRALTASEVLQNYNATKGRFGL